MSLSIIAAVGREREIGINNDIPWRGQLPEDMQRFKDLTKGHTVIMGRKTFESIGRPLPNRRNVIITSNTEYSVPEGCWVFHSLQDAIQTLDTNEQEVFIIGGSQIYEQAMPFADKMHLTVIGESYPGADTHFPVFNITEWKVAHSQPIPKDERNKVSATYIVYERRKETIDS